MAKASAANKQTAKGKLASTTSGRKTKANVVGKPSTTNVKSNKQDNNAISKTAKKELLETQSPRSAKSNEEVFAAKIKQLTAENAALRKANIMKENLGSMIPRPEKGSAGNGFNLQDRMGLKDNNELYGALRRCVRDAVNKAGLDCAIKWHRQPKHLIAQVIGVARERHEHFKRFPHGWAIEEFIKSSLKNKRAYARKRGYLEELSNSNNAGGNGHEGSVNGDIDESLNGDDMYDDEPEAGNEDNGEFKGDEEEDE